MKNYIITYNVDSYSSPLNQRTETARATKPGNALARVLRGLRDNEGVKRGVIADALRGETRVCFGRASYSRNKWASVEEAGR